MDFLKELTAIAEKNGGIIENKTALACGISRAMLSKMYFAGIIHRKKSSLDAGGDPNRHGADLRHLGRGWYGL